MKNHSLLSPTSFLIAFLGFFLNFADINCNGTKLDSIQGIEMVVGYKQEINITEANENKTEITRYDPNIFALNAFIASIIGIVLYLIKKMRNNFQLTAIIGSVGFICMLALMIDLKTKIANAQKNDSTFNFDLNIEFEMKIGYWLVVICFLIATVYNIWRMRQKKEEIESSIDEDNGELL